MILRLYDETSHKTQFLVGTFLFRIHLIDQISKHHFQGMSEEFCQSRGLDLSRDAFRRFASWAIAVAWDPGM